AGDQLVHLLAQGFNAGSGAAALGAHGQPADARMVIGRAHAAAHTVSQALPGAYADKQTGRKTAAKKLVHDFNRVEVRIAALDAEIDHLNGALVDVTFLDKVDSRLRLAKADLRRRDGFTARHAAESLAYALFHGGRVKIAHNAEDHVIRSDGAPVPCQQIVARDRRDRVVLGDSHIRIVSSVGEFGRFARGNLIQIVITARDQAGDLLLGQIN